MLGGEPKIPATRGGLTKNSYEKRRDFLQRIAGKIRSHANWLFAAESNRKTDPGVATHLNVPVGIPDDHGSRKVEIVLPGGLKDHVRIGLCPMMVIGNVSAGEDVQKRDSIDRETGLKIPMNFVEISATHEANPDATLAGYQNSYKAEGINPPEEIRKPIHHVEVVRIQQITATSWRMINDSVPVKKYAGSAHHRSFLSLLE